MKELCVTPDPALKTLYDFFWVAVARHGNRPVMGTRPIKKTFVETNAETGKNLIYYELAPYEWMSYNDIAARVTKMAAALQDMGYEPVCNLVSTN